MSLVNNRQETEVYLEHYGKKGMRWGVRRKNTKSGGGRKGRKASSPTMKKVLKQKISLLSSPKNKQRVSDGTKITAIVLGLLGAAATLGWMEGGPARKRARSATAGLQRNIDANIVRDINRLFTG